MSDHPFNDALHLLIACCQSELNKEDITFVQDTYPGLDPQHLITLAQRHGILPLIYKTLKQLSQENKIRDEVTLSLLKQHYMAIVQQNMLKSAELIQIVNIAKELDIELLPFKGPVLAEIAYQDISMRYFSDLDILVKKQDFRKLFPKLEKRGYNPYFPIHTYKGNKVMFDMNNDCPFYDTKRHIMIEIHWEFFRKLALPIKLFRPWKNTEEVTINHHTLKTLSHETHLLYHSLHGSKHVWERLGWIIDIDRIIRSIPNLDWDKIIHMAQEMGALKMFLLGPALANRYFNTPLPKSVQKLCEESKLEPFIKYVESELGSNNPSPEDSLVKLTKVIGLRDTMYYKTLTLLEFIFRPGINERRTIILPDSLFWLYWPLRPLGMGSRFLFCRLLNLCKQKQPE